MRTENPKPLRRSLSPFLCLRSLFQLGLSGSLFIAGFMILGGIFALSTFAVALVLLPVLQALQAWAQGAGLGLAFSYATSALPVGSALALTHMPAWLAVSLVLAVTVVALLVVLMVTPLVRGLLDDRLWALGFTLALFTLLISTSDLVRDWPHGVKPGRAGDVLTALNMAALVMMLAVQLLWALASFALPVARRSKLAPRVSLRAVLSRYATRGSRFATGVGIAARGLGLSAVRCALLGGGIAATTFVWFAVAAPRFGIQPADWEVLSLHVLVLGLALLSLLWDAIARRGARLFPVLLFFGLVQSALFSFAGLADGFGGVATDRLGSATTMLGVAALVIMRGWLLAPLRGATDRVREALVVTASEAVAQRARPPILLLRSFADDQVEVSVSVRSIGFALGAVKLSRPLEEVIAETMLAHGPVIAVADPSGRNPPPVLGAARESLADDDWRDYILTQIRAAQLIVCVVGQTPNFRWELDQIIASGCLAKTILVLGPGYPAHRSLAAAHPAVAAAVGVVNGADERGAYRRARVLAFWPKKQSWVALTTLMANERSFSECLRVACSMALEPLHDIRSGKSLRATGPVAAPSL